MCKVDEICRQRLKTPAKPSVVVTGATPGGIGWGVCKVLVSNGYRVFGVVRTAANGERLVKELGQDFTPLVFDVTDEAAVKEAASKVGATLGGTKLAGLVNNAGVINMGPAMHMPLSEQRRVMDVNYFGAYSVTQAFLPLLGGDRTLEGPPGKIINMSSIGGKLAAPFGSAYNASKHALEGFSGALRRELIPYGIDVIVLGPGTVITPIWSKPYDIEPYLHTDYGPTLEVYREMMAKHGKKGHTPEDVGGEVLRILQQSKPPARIAFVYGWFTGWAFPRFITDRALDKILAYMFGLSPAVFWKRVGGTWDVYNGKKLASP